MLTGPRSYIQVINSFYSHLKSWKTSASNVALKENKRLKFRIQLYSSLQISKSHLRTWIHNHPFLFTVFITPLSTAVLRILSNIFPLEGFNQWGMVQFLIELHFGVTAFGAVLNKISLHLWLVKILEKSCENCVKWKENAESEYSFRTKFNTSEKQVMSTYLLMHPLMFNHNKIPI